jgi:hypothetical protein
MPARVLAPSCHSVIGVGCRRLLRVPTPRTTVFEAELGSRSTSEAERFKFSFPNESLTHALQQITDDQEYRNWKKARNVLSHRSQPGRIIYLSNVGPPRAAEWGLQNIPIDSTATASRRRWLADSLRYLLTEADNFTAKHF